MTKKIECSVYVLRQFADARIARHSQHPSDYRRFNCEDDGVWRLWKEIQRLHGKSDGHLDIAVYWVNGLLRVVQAN